MRQLRGKPGEGDAAKPGRPRQTSTAPRVPRPQQRAATVDVRTHCFSHGFSCPYLSIVLLAFRTPNNAPKAGTRTRPNLVEGLEAGAEELVERHPFVEVLAAGAGRRAAQHDRSSARGLCG